MGPRSQPGVATAPPAAEDEARLAMLRNCAVLDASPDVELDRWTTALRRTTGASVAALCFADGSRRIVTSVCSAAGPAERVAVLALSETLDHYAANLARPTGPAASEPSYAEAPIVVDGHVLGQIGIAGLDPGSSSEADLGALGDTATAVSNALALRLAKKEAERVQQLSPPTTPCMT